ncbi:MAG TPA: hypothetical protein VH392_04825 [Sphingomicrobium sp.]
MPDTYPTLERTGDASAPVTIRRTDGSEVPVRLRLLGYDGCELESGKRFRCGEQISIHLYRMGWIRARITSCRSKIVEAEFIKECPV